MNGKWTWKAAEIMLSIPGEEYTVCYPVPPHKEVTESE